MRGRETLTYLRELERSQWRPERELRELNFRKLVEALHFAEQRVPFYRRRFAEYGVRARDVQTPDDLLRFPVLTKADVRAHGPELITEGFEGKLHRSGTGGSTGEPMVFYYDHRTYEHRMAAAMRADGWAGARLGDRELHLWGIPLIKTSPIARAKRRVYEAVLRRKMVSAFDLSEQQLAALADDIARYRPAVIIGYTNPLYWVARYLVQTGKRVPAPRGIVSTAERLFQHQRDVIERAFGAPVFDRYGCREMMLIGSECERHEGKHLNMEGVFVEVLRGARHAEPGEPGEVILTDLISRSMPFIRYKNEDIVTLSSAPCSCGRGLPMLASVEGRVLDMIVGPEGQLLAGEFFPHLLKDHPTIERFQVHQDRERAITIRLVPGEGFHPETPALVEHTLRRFLGDRAIIRVQVVSEIPLTAGGKYRHTISEVPVEFDREGVP